MIDGALRVFIVAGEASGDLLGGRLVAAMRQLHPAIEFKGIGGATMLANGLQKSLVPMEALSIMGLLEIIPKLFTIKRILNQTADALIAFDPHIIITIDSPGFNLRLMKKVAALSPASQKIHYVAPSVWAWKPKRVDHFSTYYDQILALLPFEPEYFKEKPIDCHWIGHSVVETPFDQQDKAFTLPLEGYPFLLLPGSRKTEIKRHLPIYYQTFIQLMEQNNLSLTPIIATLPHLTDDIRQLTKNWQVQPMIITDQAQKLAAMLQAKAALATSGTVSLELAMARLPHIIAYRINPISYALIRRMVNAPFVNLVNILLGREAVPECLQSDCEPEYLADRLSPLLTDYTQAEAQRLAFDAVQEKLRPDPNKNPSKLAAEAIFSLIKSKLER